MTRKLLTLVLVASFLPAVGSRAQTPAAKKEKPRCGQLVTKAQLEKLLGAKVKFDEQARPLCRIGGQSALQGTGSIQVFVGRAENNYRQMLAGARAQFKGKGEISETNEVGKKSFILVGNMFGMKTLQAGFVDGSGRYAVLISLGTGWAQPEKLRHLAAQVNENLGKL